MASLPSAVIGNTTIKLESEFKKRFTSFPSIEKVVKSGTNDNLFVMTSLVNVYGKCGAMEEARKVFDGLAKRNVVTWTSLMSGYVQNAQPELATSVFLEMLENGAFPTNYTIGVVLNACSLLYDVKLGKEVHGYVVKYGLEDDTSVGNALCNLYSKCGNNLDSAMKVFSRIGERNVVSWTTIVSACGDNGSSADGLSLFGEMLEEGIEPNEFILTACYNLCSTMQGYNVGLQVHICDRPNKVTFIGVLAACSHAGMVDEGLAYFEMMKNEYKINPIMDHYACMIDMFVRLGRLEEAFDFTCFRKLGFYVAEYLLSIKPKDPEVYTMLMNMYVSAKRCKDVSRLRKAMKEENFTKLKD
ncbi:putative pentatricopeptide repeat-containing protein [Tanacetum coccineum]